MRKAGIGALLLLNATLLTTLLMQGAEAHSGATFYKARWNPGSTVNYNVDNDVPSSMRDAMHAGLNNWDDLAAGNGPHFVNQGPIAGSNDYDPCTGPSNLYIIEDLGLVWTGRPVDSEQYLGVTQWCTSGSSGIDRITKFQITFEKTAELAGASGWYTGSGQPGANQWDLRSIATHEAGHVTGFYGHFDESPVACPLDVDRATMCGGHVEMKGTTRLRTREAHDNHTFADVYMP